MWPTRDLNHAECVAWLSGAAEGRIALSVQALPFVFMAPIEVVTGGADGLAVDVAVDPTGAELRALHGNVVAVHTDGVDLDGCRWQVLVRGMARMLDRSGSASVEQARVRADLIRGWASLPT